MIYAHSVLQIIKNLPYAYFKPVGPAFIQKCNVQFNLQPPLDPNEFGRYCFGCMVYMDVGGCYNYIHPSFYRRADRVLQVGPAIVQHECNLSCVLTIIQEPSKESSRKTALSSVQVRFVDRLLLLQCRPPLLANPHLGWDVDAVLKMFPQLPPAGYRVYRLGDRQALHQVNTCHPIGWTFVFPGCQPAPAEEGAGEGPVPVDRPLRAEGGKGRGHPRKDRGVPEGKEGGADWGDRGLERPHLHVAPGH